MKEKVRIFLRRKGHYIAGALMLAAIVSLMIIGPGRSISYDIASRFTEDHYSKKGTVAEDSSSEDGSVDVYDFSTGEFYKNDDVYDEFFGLKGLSLGYQAHIQDLDGEMFVYNADFTDPVTEDTLKAVSDEIRKKCGQLTADNYYGDITVMKSSERRIQIILDLGNAITDKAILGIFKALGDVGGVEKCVVNGEESKSADTQAETDTSAAPAVSDISSAPETPASSEVSAASAAE